MHLRRFVALLPLTLTLGFLSGCATADPNTPARAAMIAEINNEPAGDYFVGRRYYKVDYKFWGFIRKPHQPWSTAQLVMLNEQGKLAPDRELGKIGSDNGYEYKLYGSFSGETIYEPASNGFYAEFVLKGYELKTVSPASIYKTPGATDPERRVIAKPY
jgi:hypothetical protein